MLLIQPTSLVSWKYNDNFASNILHISNNIPYQTKEPTNRMKSGIEWEFPLISSALGLKQCRKRCIPFSPINLVSVSLTLIPSSSLRLYDYSLVITEHKTKHAETLATLKPFSFKTPFHSFSLNFKLNNGVFNTVCLVGWIICSIPVKFVASWIMIESFFPHRCCLLFLFCFNRFLTPSCVFLLLFLICWRGF